MFAEALKKVSPYADKEKALVNVIIETPRGSAHKFDLDHETGLFEWSLELPAGLSFPCSFGFIPNTLAEDGDPLDVVLLIDDAIPSGTMLKCRLIGVLGVKQQESGEWVENDRLIATADFSRSHADVYDLSDLREELLWDLQEFFATYNRMIDRPFELTGKKGREAAYHLLEAAIARAD